MIRFSANLGFLWQEKALIDGIYAAKAAGFKAVECHWPYAIPASSVATALQQTGLPMIGLNTLKGDVDAGESGVAAIPGREEEAKRYINQAIDYATQIQCKHIHVMAGAVTTVNAVELKQAQSCFHTNLDYACKRAASAAQTILIEPLNPRDTPGYFVSTLDSALLAIEEVSQPNLKIMFDCYHIQAIHGDVLQRCTDNLKHIAHIQIAAVPDRSEPDQGELNYPWLLKQIDNAGWTGYIGAEYKPRAETDTGLGWLDQY